MKPQQVKGTVFADLDDEKLYHVSNKAPHGTSLISLSTAKILQRNVQDNQSILVVYMVHFINFTLRGHFCR